MPPRVTGTRVESEKAKPVAPARKLDTAPAPKPRDETVKEFFKSLRGKPPKPTPPPNPHAAKGSMEKQQQLADEYLKN